MREVRERAAAAPAGIPGLLRELLRLAGAVFVGQAAIIGFGVADTVMLGRSGDTLGLATLSLGQAVYMTTYLSLAGVTQALLPALGREFGAGRRQQLAAVFRQGLWLAALLALIGCSLLSWPQPLLRLAAGSDAALPVHYLQILALGMPAAMLFRTHVALGQAVGRPMLVTLPQGLGLACKLALNVLLVAPERFGLHGLPHLGVLGCAAATSLTQWLLLGSACWQHARDPGLRPLRALAGWVRPHPAQLRALLRLGLPIGASLLVDVSSFTFMALFIARTGNVQLAAHQIAANVAAVLYMLPLALSIATGSVVARRLGGGQPAEAARAAWTGVAAAVVLSACAALLLFELRHVVASWYSNDARVAAVAWHLLALVAAYQVFDALQACSAFALRSWHIAALPGAMYALSLWGVGLAGGYVVGLDVTGWTPAWLLGAAGFWASYTAGLALAAAGIGALLWQTTRRSH